MRLARISDYARARHMRPVRGKPTAASQIRIGAVLAGWRSHDLAGLLAARSGAQPVVDAEEDVGVRQQRILEADESGTEVARGEQSYNQWRQGRSKAVAQASQPTIKVQTATAFAAGADLGEPVLARIQLEKVSRGDGERPSAWNHCSAKRTLMRF
jgi:hypothetical protein